MAEDPTAGRPFIFAIDPGLTAGVCLIQRDNLTKLYSDELKWKEAARYMALVFGEFKTELDVVCEAFRITPQTAKNSAGAAATAIEQIGQVRLMCLQYGVSDGDSLPLQTPGDAQDFSNGDKLRALGWWHKGGKGHANMALRHAALRLLRTGCRDRTLLGLDSEQPTEKTS